MKDNLFKLFIGGSGIGMTEVVEQAVKINPDDVNNVVGIIGQIIIAIATLFSLFKRKKT